MSKKIFDAFRIVCSMEELHDLLSEFQELVNETAANLTHERYTDLISVHECNMVKQKIGMESSSPLKNYYKDGFSLLTAAYYKIMDMEEKIKKTSLNIPQFDFACDVVVYPYQNQFLLKFFSTQKAYLEILRTNSKFREYEYWNNTDKPVHVSDDEWVQRAEVWDEVTSNQTWAQSGYTRELYTGLSPLMPNKLIDSLNLRYPKSKRLDIFSAEILEESVYADPNWQGRTRSEILAYLKSEASKTSLDDIKSQIEEFLVEEYTAEMLSQIKKE